MAPFPVSPACNLFPEVLLGTQRDVRKGARKLVKAALEAESWEPVLRDVPTIPIHDDESDMIVEYSRFVPDWPVWHLYWIGDLLVDMAEPPILPLIDSLSLEAMRYSWGTQGLPSGTFHKVPILRRSRTFFYQMFCQYIEILPEILIVGPRACSTLDTFFDKPPLVREALQWEGKLSMIAADAFPAEMRSGTRSRERERRIFQVTTKRPDAYGDADREVLAWPDYEPLHIVDVLIRHRLIERVDDRFRVLRDEHGRLLDP